MQKRGVPVLVFSAGLADIIEEVGLMNTLQILVYEIKLKIRKNITS